MQITDFTENVTLKVEDEVVGETFRGWLLLDRRWLRVIAWVFHLVDTELRNELLVPTDEVDVTIEITT